MNAGGEENPHLDRDALGESLAAPRDRAGCGMMDIRTISAGEFRIAYEAGVSRVDPLHAHAMACAGALKRLAE